jgi:hypothetical protein
MCVTKRLFDSIYFKYVYLACWNRTTAYTPQLQTFVTTVVMIRNVDKKTFSFILIKLWPFYFGIQAAGSALLALTFPGNSFTQSGISGLLEAPNQWGSLVPIATSFVSAALNIFVAFPAVMQVEKDRAGQGRVFSGPPNMLKSLEPRADIIPA